MKENDYLLNMLSNPNFNESDFQKIGLTTTNTSLEDKNVYKNLDFIKQNPLFQTDGKFDEVKFDQIYNLALQSYNNFANGITTDRIINEHKFYRNNIYATFDERNNQLETNIHREANPLREGRGLIHGNDVLESPFSVREIAQTQKVWDEATKSWQDAPNESFFKNFSETRVLAQWDEDGEHEDPITGQIVKHKKGQKKINENGTYYYENLNGRDIYGRDVLSKFDTLTVDGSFVNKFDFFDSDDKNKSIPGTIIRNAVKVIPAFIQYVSPVYLGLRVGLGVTDLFAKLGKVFTGSDSPTLSSIEGFTKSLEMSSSDYAQGSSEANIDAHAWSMENILNIGADTFTQLAEQRWIFKFAPAIFKGRAGIQNKFGEAGAEKLKKEAISSKNISKSFEERWNLITKSGKNPIESKQKVAQLIAEFEHVSKDVGEEALSKYMKSYNEFGKIISQAYMTGITVGDAYGEAKQEGASDVEASLLTLGYALGEYALLNSNIGQWILPELKQESRRFKSIGTKLAGIEQPPKSASPQEKMNWIRKIVNLGKQSVDKIYNDTSKELIPSMVSGSLAEGVEEVSEELLYDVSKSLFNVIGYLRGDETRLSSFDDVANRYGLSFVGGALGGTIASIDSNFREAKYNKPPKDYDAAFQELVHIVKENKTNEFLSTIDKMTFNSDGLSAIKSQDGSTDYFPGTTKDNQDKAIKDAIHEQVAIIQRILDANGALIDDESILGVLTDAGKTLKYSSLKNSTFAGQFLQEFNSISSQIVTKVQELNKPVSDEVARSEEYKKNQNILKQEIQDLIDKKDAFIKGKRSGEFIEKSLWEMSDDISGLFLDVNKIQWIESRENKKIKDIAPDRLKTLEEEWNTWSEYNRKDKLEIAFRVFKHMNLLASDMLKTYDSSYFNTKTNDQNIINDFQNLFGAKIASYVETDQNGDYQIQDEDLLQVSSEGSGNNFNAFSSTQAMVANLLVNKFEKLDQNKFTSFNQKLNDAFNQSSPEDQELKLMYLMESLLEDDQLVNSILDDIKNIPYLNYSSKISLLNSFEIFFKYQEATGGEELSYEAQTNSQKIAEEIRKKEYSPVLDLINKWTLHLKNTDISVENLLNQLKTQYDTLTPSNNLSEFSIQEDNAKRIDTVLKNIKMLKATILAARTDAVSGSNRVGYNVTANELLKLDLAEIDKNSANVLLQDIAKIENRLKYYQRLHIINSGQKLKEHHKVSVNKDIISYNKLKRLILEQDWPPSDWNGSNELKQVFKEQFEIIDTLDENEDIESRKLVLNDFEKVSLKRDVQKIDTAIHNFFKANQENLKDTEKLSQLLNSNLFRFDLLDDGLLNIRTQEMGDTQFVWWLATRAAMNPDDFYSVYKDNFISEVAPIPGQEQAIMMAVAAVLNGEIFHNFAQAYNLSLGKNVENLDNNYLEGIKGSRTLTRDYLDSDKAVQFFRHFLIEGIAGSGKSTAVAKMIVNILRQSDKGQQLLNNIWFVHASKEQARMMAKELGLGDDYEHVYSREEYLEKISPGVTKMRNFEGNQLKLNKDDLIQRDGETLYRYNSDINKGFTKEPPSLIFMDEVTGFSQQDLLLSEDFSNYYGLMNIVFGDFVQDGLEGTLDLGNSIYLNSAVFRGNFAGSFKLGDSLRTSNGVKDYNNKILQSNIYEILHGRTSEKIKLKWWTDGTKANNYQDSTIILGDKIHITQSYDSVVDQVKADIDILLRQLPDKEKLEDHEKLGFIYTNPNSPIYQYLDGLNKNGKYKDKILLKEGSSSQGLEADFYVIDIEFPSDDSKSNSKFYRQLYTGLTRAKKATVGIVYGAQNLLDNYGDPEEIAGEFSLSETGIEQYAKDTKKIYDDVYSQQGSQLIYNKFNDSNSSKVLYTINGVDYEQNKNPNNIGLNSNDQFEYEGDIYILKDFITDSSGKEYVWATLNDKDYLFELSDFISNILPKIKSAINPPNNPLNNPDEKEKELDELNLDKIDVRNDNEDELNMLLHSFATNEIGIEEIREETNGRISYKYKITQGFDQRVDNINGLLKIFGIAPSQDGTISIDDYTKLKKILDVVRSSALYAKSQSEILSTLTSQLEHYGIELKNLKTRLIFKSNNIPGKESQKSENDFVQKYPKYLKLFKSIKEQIKGLFVKKGEHVEPTTKHISILITQTDSNNKEKAILEIPLLNLTNPLTMIESIGFEDVKKIVNDIEDDLKKNGTYSVRKVLELTISKLESEPVKMSKSFIKLSKLYLNINNGKVLLLDDFIKNKYGLKEGEITLNNIFESTGPLITTTEKGTGTGRHADYRGIDLSYKGQWMNLEEYKRDSGKIVSDIFVLEEDKYDTKAGHPFVIVTDSVHNEDLTTDEQLLNQYVKQCQNPSSPKLVKRVYVSPPTVSVIDYFENLNAVYKKNEKADPTIGSDLTSFNLFKMIVESGIFENKTLFGEPFYAPGSSYSKLKSKILELAQLQNSMSHKDFINLISGNGIIGSEDLETFSKKILGGNPTPLKSWKSFLQGQLRWYVMSDFNGAITNTDFTQLTKLQNDRLQAIEQMLKQHNINGIFYSPELETDINTRNEGEFKRIRNNKGIYKGKSYLINGKIDSTAFKGDVIGIIDYILESSELKSGETNSKLDKDTLTYLNDNYSIFNINLKNQKNQKQQFINNFIENKVYTNFGYTSKIKSLVKDYINSKNDQDYNESELINYLRNKNYFVKEDITSGNYIILPIESVSVNGQLVNGKLSNDSETLTINEKEYKLQSFGWDNLTQKCFAHFTPKSEDNSKKSNNLTLDENLTHPIKNIILGYVDYLEDEDTLQKLNNLGLNQEAEYNSDEMLEILNKMEKDEDGFVNSLISLDLLDQDRQNKIIKELDNKNDKNLYANAFKFLNDFTNRDNEINNEENSCNITII